jgi:hypothetical protein
MRCIGEIAIRLIRGGRRLRLSRGKNWKNKKREKQSSAPRPAKRCQAFSAQKTFHALFCLREFHVLSLSCPATLPKIFDCKELNQVAHGFSPVAASFHSAHDASS